MLKKILLCDVFKTNQYYCGILWTTSGLLGISVEKHKYDVQLNLLANYNIPQYKLFYQDSTYRSAIHAYFDGYPIRNVIKIDYSPYTNWQMSVYNSVLNIPYGQTLSYKDIAVSLNCPNASRAVGSALKRNKHLLIIPCHRVLLNDGSIGGYSAGIELKKYLLNLEKVHSSH